MEMKGERQLPADRATAWALLNDSEVLKQCVPGCESMAASGAGSYDILMTTAIGPVRARFKGKLSLTDIEAPSRYRLLFDVAQQLHAHRQHLVLVVTNQGMIGRVVALTQLDDLVPLVTTIDEALNALHNA